MESISKYIDIELLMIIGIAILLFLLLNFLFKKISMPMILKRFLIIGSVLLVGIFGMNYLAKEEEVNREVIYSNFMMGRVDFVGESIDQIKVDYIKSNIKPDLAKKIVVNIKPYTKITQRDSNGVHNIKLSDLKLADVVTIYFPENSLKGEHVEITAAEIVKKGK